MGFKFRLQALLKQRKTLEEVAKREYMQAQALVNESNRKINSYWSDIDMARKNVFEAQQKVGASSNYWADFDQYIKGLKVKIENEKVILRQRLVVSEEKKEGLIQASREHKVMIKLREKMEREYLLMRKKKEQKDLDDMVTMRYKRNKR